MTYVVQTNKLTKTIGEKNLVTNVSMHVKKGEIYPVQRTLTSGPITGSILLGLCILMVQGLVNSFGIGYYLVKHRKETL